MNKAELLKVLDEALNQLRHNDLRLAVMCIGRAKAIVEGRDDWMDKKAKTHVELRYDPNTKYTHVPASIITSGEPKEQKVERGVVWPKKKEYPNLMVYSINAVDFMKGWNACLEECKRLNEHSHAVVRPAKKEK